jgi:hypothetical protein
MRALRDVIDDLAAGLAPRLHVPSGAVTPWSPVGSTVYFCPVLSWKSNWMRLEIDWVWAAGVLEGDIQDQILVVLG